MSIYINSPEADRLAEALTRLTAESKAEAVIISLRERLERKRREIERQTLTNDLIEIGRRCVAQADKPPSDHGDFLYDDRGLPQ